MRKVRPNFWLGLALLFAHVPRADAATPKGATSSPTVPASTKPLDPDRDRRPRPRPRPSTATPNATTDSGSPTPPTAPKPTAAPRGPPRGDRQTQRPRPPRPLREISSSPARPIRRQGREQGQATGIGFALQQAPLHARDGRGLPAKGCVALAAAGGRRSRGVPRVARAPRAARGRPRALSRRVAAAPRALGRTSCPGRIVNPSQPVVRSLPGLHRCPLLPDVGGWRSRRDLSWLGARSAGHAGAMGCARRALPELLPRRAARPRSAPRLGTQERALRRHDSPRLSRPRAPRRSRVGRAHRKRVRSRHSLVGGRGRALAAHAGGGKGLRARHRSLGRRALRRRARDRSRPPGTSPICTAGWARGSSRSPPTTWATAPYSTPSVSTTRTTSGS